MHAYLKRFNNEALLVDEADNKAVLITFISGLQPTKFFYSLSEKPSSTMVELMHKAQKHINAEKAMVAHGKETLGLSKKRAEPDPPKPPRDNKSEKKPRHNDRPRFQVRFERFMPLNTTPECVLVHLVIDLELQWPREMRPGVPRDQSKYCHFHRDHGHETSDCIKLKKLIEALI